MKLRYLFSIVLTIYLIFVSGCEKSQRNQVEDKPEILKVSIEDRLRSGENIDDILNSRSKVELLPLVEDTDFEYLPINKAIILSIIKKNNINITRISSNGEGTSISSQEILLEKEGELILLSNCQSCGDDHAFSKIRMIDFMNVNPDKEKKRLYQELLLVDIIQNLILDQDAKKIYEELLSKLRSKTDYSTNRTGLFASDRIYKTVNGITFKMEFYDQNEETIRFSIFKLNIKGRRNGKK